jgi:hypothetical protein
MRKLNKRQIIILGVMLLAVLYGAYEFFSTGRKGQVVVDTAKKAVDLNAFIGDITSSLTKDSSSPVDAHMIKRAETPWLRDPFYERKSYRQLIVADKPAQAGGAATFSVEKSKFNYTGYLDMGSKKIAIVNGSEYAAGDALDVDGYVLNGIYPDRIVVHHRENRRTLDIPLQE